MKEKIFQTALLVAGAFVLHSASFATEPGDITFSLAVGADYATGTYGTDTDIEDTYLPLTAVLSGRKMAFRLTLPYLSVSAPEGTIYDADGVPLPGSGAMTTESGLGDIIAGLTVYDVISSERHQFAMDITAKAKLGTADYDLGLGTGENDYSLQADFYKFVGKVTWMGSVGYRFRGDPADVELDDTIIAAIGSTYRFSPDVKGGLFLNYRESSLDGNDAAEDLTVFVSRRIADNWRLQGYVLTGFGDSSPDWGGGIQVRKVFDNRD